MEAVRAMLVLATLVAFAGCSGSDANDSRYPDLQESPVRGLSPEQIQGLRAGEGMGYALPAELNGYPGPKHVLELAEELSLNATQRSETTALRQSMLAEAKRVGETLIAAYEELDGDFRANTIDAESLRKHTETIGALEGELRSIHMEAHLGMMRILTHEQIVQYSELRGYDAAGHSQHGH